jgi:hypothetical protein
MRRTDFIWFNLAGLAGIEAGSGHAELGQQE